MVCCLAQEQHYARASLYLGRRDEKRYQCKLLYLHKLVHDSEISKDIIDHIDNNTLNNIKSNLRKTSSEENSKNRSGRNSNNKSVYRNVCWNKSYKMWLFSYK